jgi:hypothetical protein
VQEIAMAALMGCRVSMGQPRVFAEARFHIGRFVTAAVDTEADRENIKALYSSLKSTSAPIDVGALKTPYYTFSTWF